jgi:hypothetical protein
MKGRGVSERKRVSNQKNAQMSTGPKSLNGKRRSARNALDHGLAIPAATLPHFQEDVRTLALSIARACGSEVITDLSLQAAEAQVEMARVSKARAAVLSQNISIERINEKLSKLERYERRAFSRRNRALRAISR